MTTPSLLLDQVWDATECILHALLYHREVYPDDSFDFRCYFDIPSVFCQHPSVVSYFSSFRPVLQDLLPRNLLKAVILTLSVEDRPVEQYWIEYEFDDDVIDVNEDSFMKRRGDSAITSFRGALNACLRTLDVSGGQQKPKWSGQDADVDVTMAILPREALDEKTLRSEAIRFNSENLQWAVKQQSDVVMNSVEALVSLVSTEFFKIQVAAFK